MSLATSAPASFQVQPDQLIVMRALRPLTGEEATDMCEELLRRAGQSGSWRWLFDVRRDSGPKPREFNAWLLNEFMPRAHAALQQRLCVAYLVAPALLSRLREQAPAGNFLVGALAARAHIRFFVTEDKARTWLLEPAPGV